MPTTLTERKIREARFFLTEMQVRDRQVRLDRSEEFGFLLSAFLTAARSVWDVLRKENKKAGVPKWESWVPTLTSSVAAKVGALRDLRDDSVHQGVDGTIQVEERVRWLSAPGTRQRAIHDIPMPAYDPGASVAVASYYLEIDGVRHPAVALCRHYLEEIEAAVARYT